MRDFLASFFALLIYVGGTIFSLFFIFDSYSVVTNEKTGEGIYRDPFLIAVFLAISVFVYLVSRDAATIIMKGTKPTDE